MKTLDSFIVHLTSRYDVIDRSGGNKTKGFMGAKFLVLLISFLFTAQISSAQVEKTDSINSDSVAIDKPLLHKNDSVSEIRPIDSLATDSVVFVPAPLYRIPQRASLYSAILPGLGQAYNGMYWKIPIIYSALGTMYFLARSNNQRYLEYKDAYKYFDDPDRKYAWVGDNVTRDQLKERKDYYKRNRDFNIIIGVMFYLLNILDANVDAHLMNFDVSEDLSLNIQPDPIYFQASQKNQNISGFGIKFVLSLNR